MINDVMLLEMDGIQLFSALKTMSWCLSLPAIWWGDNEVWPPSAFTTEKCVAITRYLFGRGRRYKERKN